MGSCGDWMNKIARDRKRKMHDRYPHKSREGSREKPKKKNPSISEEQQQRFDRNMKDIYKNELAKRTNKSIEEKEKLKIQYEEKCKEIFRTESRKRLGYTDIPWPHSKDDGVNEVESFLFDNMKRGSEDYKKYLREQQIRWHPDRFLQKCGEQLKSRYKEKIMTKVKEISQLLNSISDTI